LLAAGIAALGLGLALFGLISVEWSANKLFIVPQKIYRWTDKLIPSIAGIKDVVNPNILAGALMMTSPFPLAMLLANADLSNLCSVPESSASAAGPPLPRTAGRAIGRTPSRRWFTRTWFGLSAAVSLVVLALTESRGAWIGTGAAVGILVIFRWKRLAWLAPFALLGFAWVAWQAAPPLVEEGLSGQMGRVELWNRALYMIQDMPFTGIGAGTFDQMADTQFPFFLHGSWVEHVHNLFLQVAVDLGIPGLIAYLAILLLSMWSAIEGSIHLYQSGDRALAALGQAGVASLAGMIVHGWVDATTWIVGRGAFIPWMVIGTILALHQQSHATR
jgi:putative inorganic carbon (HCO3(-)) transporter